MAEHGHRAGGDDLCADDRAHQCGLAAAGRAEQSRDGAAGDLHREVVYRGSLAADDAEVIDGDHRLDTVPKQFITR